MKKRAESDGGPTLVSTDDWMNGLLEASRYDPTTVRRIVIVADNDGDQHWRTDFVIMGWDKEAK